MSRQRSNAGSVVLVTATLGLGLAGCKSNPFPENESGLEAI